MEFSMEFQFHKIQWNSMEKYNEKNPSNVYEKFHGIPWKIPWIENSTDRIQWNSMEFSMKEKFP
jgi:hypothetical protein